MAVITPRAGDITDEQLKKYVAAMNAVSNPQQLQAIYDDLNNFLQAAGGDIQGLPRLQSLYDLVNQKYTYMTATPSLGQEGASAVIPTATVTSQPTGMETQMFEGERSPQSIYRRWASNIPGVQSTSPFAQYLNSMGYMALGNYLMNALPQYAGANTPQSFADFMQNKQGGAFSSPGGSNYSALGNLWNMPQPGVGASDADLQAYQRAKEVMDYMDTTSEGRAGSFMGVLANSPIYNQLPGFMKSYARNRLGDVYNQYEDIAPAGTGFFPWLRKIYGV